MKEGTIIIWHGNKSIHTLGGCGCGSEEVLVLIGYRYPRPADEPGSVFLSPSLANKKCKKTSNHIKSKLLNETPQEFQQKFPPKIFCLI